MKTKIALVAIFIMLGGCAKQDFYRTEGLTLGAGDAIARNSALQIIDPWPAGVEDPNIKVPADHGRPSDPAVTPAVSTANP